MANHSKIWILLFAVSGLVLLFWKFPSESPDRALQSPAPENPGDTVNKQGATAGVQSRVSSSNLVTRLYGELEFLKSVHGESEAQKRIQDLFVWLEEAPVDEATAAVVELLNAKVDALAFGRFKPGQDGFLIAYPSFRTALLDALEKLDPAEAVLVSKGILNTSENPDEWALSLRILNRHANSNADRQFLSEKVEALLVKEAWLKDPSFAFLHAFDAAVADGQAQTVARLAELVDEAPNRAVGHAATLSVDRFFQLHTSVGVGYVTSHPDFLQTATGFRASLMARAHPDNASDMAAVELYLGGDSVSKREKETFFESFPNFNSTFSHNLITGPLMLSRSEMRSRSMAALKQLKHWVNDHRYPENEDTMNRAISRLTKTWKVEL